MDRFQIIGLCGFAGAGKDTAADILVQHAGFYKVAFADALKAQLVEAFHVEPLVFVRPELKSQPMAELALSRSTEVGFINAALRAMHDARPGQVQNNEELVRPRPPREVMQLWGTEYRRASDDKYWVSQLVNRITYLRREIGPRGIVVTDCRFANEVDTLRAMGAQLWQIKRPGLQADSTHSSASDGSQFGPDAILVNAHDVKHLKQLVLGEYWALDAGLEGLQVRIP